MVPDLSPRVSHLPLHVHDHYRAGAVTHHKLLRVLGQKEYVVDHDVYSSWRAWRLEGTVAFASLHIPNLRGGLHLNSTSLHVKTKYETTLTCVGYHTLMMPSADALMMWWPSLVNVASLTKDVWPLSSLRVLPDFRKWILNENMRPYITKSLVYTLTPSSIILCWKMAHTVEK